MDAISHWLVAMGVSPLIGGAIAGALATYVFLRLVTGDQTVKPQGAFTKAAVSTTAFGREANLKGLITGPMTSVRLQHNGQSIELSEAKCAELVAAIRSGQVIEAIKLVRNSGGFDLKEAKDIVDAMKADGPGRN